MFSNWEEFMASLDKQHYILAPWCDETACEENVRTRSAKDSKMNADDVRVHQVNANSGRLVVPSLPEKPKPSASLSLCVSVPNVTNSTGTRGKGRNMLFCL